MMQRLILWLSAVLALYVSGFACATGEPVPAQPLPLLGVKPQPHIALILPLRAELFAPAAGIVQRGFLAAAEVQPHVLPVRVYSAEDEERDIVPLYRQAIAAGARAVVGPLTRNGVSALAKERNIPVPTLTLNIIDETAAGPLNFFGMAAEAEARQIAQLALQKGYRNAVCISVMTQLSQRLMFAFEDEWNKLGGKDITEIDYESDSAPLESIKAEDGTVVFLAVGAAKAQLIRPYLPKRLPIYATSQVYLGDRETLINYELDGIQFVDMPWLLQPDHPAVMIYPHNTPPLSTDQERLYALGIDAYRLILLMVDDKVRDSLPLDGVSGRIQRYGYTFERAAMPAYFGQGRALIPGRPVEAAPAVFPDVAAASQTRANPGSSPSDALPLTSTQ